ncbi:MAG: redox-regulated ATPase YchF [Candidatus Thermoplasmatota archaeon]|nr:redox-regulated ATPase YchF [Candidatus Thermoplasmatota archaeon]
MKIGVIGKPNVGKSTLFSALTQTDVPMADYPFTTVKPNIGIAYVRKRCPHTEFGIECNPRNAPCLSGTRMLPIELIDVAGLVPGAHEGKGLGNKFLDDLRQADGFIIVIDASGKLDLEGNPAEGSDPLADVVFLKEEIYHWVAGIIKDGWVRAAKRLEIEKGSIEEELARRVTGLGISASVVNKVINRFDLTRPEEWSDEDFMKLAEALWEESKPMVIAANKCDVASDENMDRIKSSGYPYMLVSAIAELTLKKAEKAGAIKGFEIMTRDPRQRKGLEYIMERVMDRFGTTGVQECLEKLVFDMLDIIAVYPVENETKLCDKYGNVLPDAYLIKRGATARDLAYLVHTDLGEKFIRAINCRTKRVVGADYALEDGDIIKIISHK